jgi:hypothetical protein
MADELDHYRQLLMDDRRATHALAAEARAALEAQPESQGPSKHELFGLLMQAGGATQCVSVEWLEPFADAVLARYGRPAIEPVPVSAGLPGPTDEELEDFALQNGGGYFNCDCQEEADILTRKHISNYRAVLARWGRPAIEPVPVSDPPGPEDCDAEGRCWLWNSYENMWDLIDPRYRVRAEFPHSTYWLPHWALPVPGLKGE